MGQIAQIDFNSLYSKIGQSGTLTLGNILSPLLTYLFALAGIGLLLYLLWGGFNLMLSSGDPKKIEGAKAQITNAFVGFIIVFTSYWIVKILGLVVNVPGIINTFK
mgnify:CR=1 FL=1